MGEDTNEAVTNEAAEGNEAAAAAAEAAGLSKARKETMRLPTQLNRLPADKLEKVLQALQELQDSGLSEIPDLAAMSKVVKANTGAGNARLPEEDLTSEYMGMCLWAWTPKRWFDNNASVASKPASGAEREDAATNEASNEAAAELPPVDDKVGTAFQKKVAAWETWNSRQTEDSRKVDIDKARAWYDAMKQADAQLRSFPSMEPGCKQAGEGSGVLFQSMPAASGPRVLPKVKVSRANKGPVFSGSGSALKGKETSVISVHLGDEGCGTGLASWQRIVAEHGLGADGRATDGAFYGKSSTLFAESTTGRYVPRAVFAGYGGEQMDACSKAGIFAPTSILTGKQDGDGWFDGVMDSKFFEETLDSVRQQVEKADVVQGLLVTHFAGEDGRTSGLTSQILRNLSVDYGKKYKFTVTGAPDPHAGEGNDTKARAFGGLLHQALIEHVDLVNYYDRTSLMNLASAKVNGLGLSSPGTDTLNGLVARLISGITGPMRFAPIVPASEGSRLLNFSSIASNLVCYPRIHFVLPSLGGIVGEGMSDFIVDSPPSGAPGCEAAMAALSNGCLSTANRGSNRGKIIAISLLCRGLDLYAAMSKVMESKCDKKFQFVDWSPTGFVLSNYTDPKKVAPEVVSLENNCSVKSISASFLAGLEGSSASDLGAEAGDVSEAKEDLRSLGQDYDEVGTETAAEEEEEEY